MINDGPNALRPPGLGRDEVVRLPLKYAPIPLFSNPRGVVRVPGIIASIIIVVASLVVRRVWLRSSDVGIVVVILRGRVLLLVEMLIRVRHGRRLR